jgi:aldehyde:ferredoxin oxidoreductase
MGITGKGYCGKILRVDLTTKKISEQRLTGDLVRKYLGGNGIAARIIYDEIKPGTDPMSPDNKLVFMTGPLNGTRVPFASKFGVWSLSPLTNNFHDSLVSAAMAAETKYAGYDGFVFEGRSEKPVYVWIDDNVAKICDAGHLWGKKSSDTHNMILEDLGDSEIQVACIGPSGEKKVRYANIGVGVSRRLGRGGLGAVMGFKNLKAVAVRGQGSIEVTDLEGVQKFADNAYERVKNHSAYVRYALYGTPGSVTTDSTLGISFGTRNWREEYFEDWEKLSGEFMRERFTVKDLACPNCPVGCSHTTTVRDGPYAGTTLEGPEFESIYAFGPMCGNNRLDAIIAANKLCDEYGIDTISTGVTIAFAMECYEKGLVTSKDTDGIELTWGNHDAIISMVEKIAEREGFGDLLAEGSWRAANKIGKGAEKYSMTAKKLELPGHSPRTMRGMMLAYAVNTCGGRHHDARPTAEYGEIDRLEVKGKPEFVRASNHMCAVGDSLIICRFSERLYGHTLNQRYVDMVNLVTGFGLSLEDLELIGETIYNLERAINVRCGIRRRDDRIPDRFFKDALTAGPAKGEVANREVFNNMLDKYYELRGWDKNTGIPTKKKLLELGLEDVTKDIEKLNP